MSLREVLQNKAMEWGADLFGVADLEPHRERILEIYGKEFGGYQCAISFGVFMPGPVVDELLEHPSHIYLAYYDIANSLINEIGLRLNNYLVKEGHKAFPIPSSQRSGEAKEGSIFSHRMAGELAGLGWIGKNSSLVNDKVGPRLRLGTVLTNAALVADSPVENKCGECRLCTEICPANAILGKNYEYGQPLEERFIFHRCDDYLTEVRQTFGKRICGKCVAVCPYGR
ncbi:MAG: 4Fe-4S double cluster binding domain-containing protein [Bacillota bacterium]|nr:4Fe-4S double cluster binding domain-containing protein [Bacillota bacterium]